MASKTVKSLYTIGILLTVYSVFQLASLSSAHALTELQVVKSSLKHYPLVRTDLLEIESSQAALLESLGAFDFKVEGENKTFLDGYYDGRFNAISAKKNLGYFNTSVYGGYRKSSGNFPVYNDELFTSNDGETFLGFKLSLLQDNFIDKNRLNFNVSKQEVDASRSRYNQTVLEIQNASIQAYWKWVTIGYQAAAVEEILKLAQIRDRNIRRRIKVGDLARIYASENRQYILKREAELLKIENKFQQASAYLSLFYRDENGKPILLNKTSELPPIHVKKIVGLDQSPKFMDFVYSNNPELQELYISRKQQEEQLRFAKNRFLPQLDLKYELAMPRGGGESRLTEDESYIGVNFAIPIEFRKERGKYQKEKLKLQSLDIKIDFLKDKINNMIFNNITNLETAQRMYDLTLEQTKLAKKLVDAEQVKFRQGASDLILLNLREEALAEAKISNLEALMKLKTQYADFLSLKMELLN